MANTSDDKRISVAREAYALGKPDKALDLVKKILAEDPQDVDALSLRAAVLYDLDRDEEAEVCHKAVLELRPHSVEALHGLASLANDRQDFERALTMAERGFHSIPKDHDPEFVENADYRLQLIAELYNEKAFALWYLGRRDEAERLLTEEAPSVCPLETELFEEELEWLLEHPDNPDEGEF